MFTSLEQFYKNYRIKNEAQPNETTLNRPSMRLKREVREIKSVLDIITGEGIEEWTEKRFYEKDEYVQYLGSYYISLKDDNINNDPTAYSSEYWSLVDLPIIGETLPSLCKTDEFIADGETQTFELSEKISGNVMVYIGGVLQNSNTYSHNSRDIIFVKAPEKDALVSVVYGYQYITANQLPRRDYVATAGQYLFNTPFELTNPAVFANGVLLPSSYYTFSSNRVELLYSLSEGDIVSVTNGTYYGYDTYSKAELDTQFKLFLTIDDTYNKDAINALLDDKLDTNTAKITYVRKNEIYEKSVLDNKFTTFEENIDIKVDEKLAGYVTKGTTLADYGITDAYTQSETSEIFNSLLEVAMTSGTYKEILESKLDTSEFTAQNIYNLLDTESFYKNVVYNNKYQTITGGLDLQDNKGVEVVSIDTINNVEVNPSIEVRTNVSSESSSHFRVFSDLNTDDLILTIEGDFKGTFAFNLSTAGVHDYNKYNWVIKVIPTMAGDNLDYVPIGYGNQFTFESTKTTSSSQTLYNYGWISNDGKTVNLVSACQCDGTVKETYAHYVLTGYDKRISQHRVFNQGDNIINVIKPKSETAAQSAYAISQYYDITTPEAPSLDDNGLEKLTVDTTEPAKEYKAGTINYLSALKVYADKYAVSAGGKCTVWIVGAIIGDHLKFITDGAATLDISEVNVTDAQNIAFTLAVNASATSGDKITVSVVGNNSATEKLVVTVA